MSLPVLCIGYATEWVKVLFVIFLAVPVIVRRWWAPAGMALEFNLADHVDEHVEAAVARTGDHVVFGANGMPPPPPYLYNVVSVECQFVMYYCI